MLGTRLEQQPAVLQAATEVRNAWLALQRTQIVSPISGYVSRRSVQPGAQIGTTTPLMAVVPATNLWIDANFKETPAGAYAYRPARHRDQRYLRR